MIIVVNPKNVKYIFCSNCKKRIRAEFHEKNTEKKTVRWIIVRQCEKKFFGCGEKEKILLTEEVDSIQPNSQLWDLVYSDDPFEDTERRKKELDRQKEKRKEKLDSEYNKKFTKPWERKFVKDIVLKEENTYGL